METSMRASWESRSSLSVMAGRVSLAGIISMESIISTERCVAGSNVRRLSTSFPQSSIRAGYSAPTGKMSIIPPRLLTDPGA